MKLNTISIPRFFVSIGISIWIILIFWSYNLDLLILGEDEEGVLETINWFPYPLFFLLVGWLAKISWEKFSKAWVILANNDILVGGLKSLRKIKENIVRWRVFCSFLAFFIAFLLTYIDAGCVVKRYDENLAQAMRPSIALVCNQDKIDFFTKNANPSDENALSDPNFYYAMSWYLLQWFLSSLALLALFHICIHQFSFILNSRSNIRLNPFDPMREFGLTSWNRSLNYTYGAIAVCMIVPILSYLAQPSGPSDPASCPGSLGCPDFGQIVLHLALPALFLVPILLAIVGRQICLDEVKVRIQSQINTDGIDDSRLELFHQQSLWPFDRSIIGKFSFSVILIEYAIVTSNAHEIIKKLVG